MKYKSFRFLACLLLLCVLLVGCKNKNLDVVAVCGGDDVLREEYTYLSARPDDTLTEAEKKQSMEQSIIEDRAILTAGKELLGVTPDDSAVETAVDGGYDDAVENYGSKKELQSALKEQNLTEHHFRRMLAIAEIQRLLQNNLFAGTELESESSFAVWLKSDENYARVEQFVFSTQSDAEEFITAVRNGQDAGNVCTSCNGTYKKASYCFRGLGSTAFDTALFALPDDGKTLSAVVEDDGTFLVLRRQSVSDTEQEDMAAMQGLAVRDKLRDKKFEALIASYAEKLTVTWLDD